MKKILIVEGVWGSGKTPYISNLLTKEKATVLYEPNHTTLKTIPPSLTDWYTKKHLNDLKRAIILSKNANIIIERSPFSAIIFNQLFLNNIDNSSLKIIKELLSTYQGEINFHLLFTKDYKYSLRKMRQFPHLSKFTNLKTIKCFETELVNKIKQLKKDIPSIKYKFVHFKALDE